MRVLLSLLSVLVSCASPTTRTQQTPVPSLMAHDPCEKQVCANVTLNHAAARLEVELRLPAGLGVVHLPFYPEPFKGQAGGFGGFATLDDGRPFPEAIEVTGEPKTLRYHVDLTHHLAKPAHGIDEVPHPNGGGWTLVGRAFLPVMKSDAATIDRTRLVLAVHANFEGWKIVSSAGEGSELTASLPDLRDAFYLVGKFETQRLKTAELIIDVASADYGRDSLTMLTTLLKKLHGRALVEFGPLSRARRLVVFNRKEKGFEGGVIGDGISVLSSTPPSARAMTPVGTLLIHEFMHLWFQAEQRWLGEGFDVYAQIRMQTALDAVSEQEAIDYFLNTAHDYLGQIGQRRILDLADESAYAAGAVLGFCIDVELQREGESFSSVWRGFRATVGPGRTTQDEYLEYLEKVAPGAHKAARRWLEMEGPLSVAGCLERAGYEVVRHTYQGYSLRAIALDLIKSPSFSMQRAELFAVNEGSAFQVGDIITKVNGQPIGRLTELGWLLRDTKAGATVDFEVRRGAANADVRLAVPEVAAEQRPWLQRITTSGSGRYSPFRSAQR